MRLQQFLNEGKDISKLNGRDALKLIREECNPWLRDGVPIFRGLRTMDTRDSIFYKTPRSDREPLSDNYYKHKLSDKIFKELFGWNGRSEALLVTTDVSLTKHFGSPYAIFPVGNNFDYIYSKEVGDFIDIGLNVKNEITTHFTGMDSYRLENMIADRDEEVIKKYTEFIEENYTDRGLDDRHKGEVMLKCNKYIALKLDDNQLDLISEDDIRGLYK